MSPGSEPDSARTRRASGGSRRTWSRGGQFRHHAAEFGVDGALRVHGVREQAARGVVDRDAGLVAGGLDPEDAHPPATVRAGRPVVPFRLACHSG